MWSKLIDWWIIVFKEGFEDIHVSHNYINMFLRLLISVMLTGIINYWPIFVIGMPTLNDVHPKFDRLREKSFYFLGICGLFPGWYFHACTSVSLVVSW